MKYFLFERNKYAWGALIRRQTREYGSFVIRLCWPLIRFEINGVENIPKVNSRVFIVNHNSMIDLYISGLIPVRQALIFARSWPFKLYIFTIYMKWAKHINLEKISVPDAIDTVAKEVRDSNGDFLFFPEGHRSYDGKLQKFYSGAFVLATSLDVPIVPVVFRGTHKFSSKRDHLIRPTKVFIDFLPPVMPPYDKSKNQAYILKNKLHAVYKEFLANYEDNSFSDAK